jgi:copper(I)-binding protein
MMRRLPKIALSLATVLLLSACGAADDADPTDRAQAAADAAADPAVEIEVHDVRSRMSPMVAGAAAIYLTLDNPTDTDDALVAGRVPEDIGAAVELHETYEIDEDDAGGMQDGGDMGDGDMGDGDMGDGAAGGHGAGDAAAPMMGMREIPSIEIPAGGQVELVPGGLHLMVMDLVDDLEVGDRYELVLEFEHADPVTVTVEVREHV